VEQRAPLPGKNAQRKEACRLHGSGWLDGTNPFTQPTPLGGQYEWDNEAGLKSITLYNLTASVAEVTKLDAVIDDGNPSTGLFQYNGSEWHFLLEP
jgi:hypothetical protein